MTHNRTSTPLTLGEVLVTAVVPLGLLAYLTVYYTRKRVPDDDSTDKNPASR